MPLSRALEVARESGALSVVIETRYVDLDYRSEYSSFFSRTFASIPDTAHRLHFFGAEVAVDDLAQLSEAVCDRYIGYMVVRPSPLGRVGRTLLQAPPEFSAANLALVTDHVDLFGQRLTVRGVPFAQQDTQFGRCAHVAAWICHYSAHLRGDVRRRTMADFTLLADSSVAEGRPLPSQGLTGLQLSNLMRDFDIPPIMYRLGSLPTSGVEPPHPPHDPDADPGTWDTVAIPVTCRYLNSRYPVLVGTHDHAFVVIGYQKAHATADGPSRYRFVRHDDQRGPYLWVEDILHDVDPATGDLHTPWQMLLAPVPEKLWLMPEAAERKGRILIDTYDGLEGSGELADLADRGTLTFRTTALRSSTYKEICGGRGLDPESVRDIRLTRMSRYIWVVEATDRELSAAGKPAVVGEAVFDATSPDAAPTALVLWTRGAMMISQTSGNVRSPLPTTTSELDSVRQYL